MDVNTLYHRTVEFFADRVNAVQDDQWAHPTPCAGWTVLTSSTTSPTRTSGRSRSWRARPSRR